MRKLALAIVLASFLTGCAITPTHPHGAQLADIATTAIALSNGAVESNPVLSGLDPAGLAVVAGAKLLLPSLAKQLPYEACKLSQSFLFGSGYGAALGNLTVIFGVAGSAWPVAIPTAVIAGLLYNKSSLVQTDCLSPAWQKVFAEHQKQGRQKSGSH